MVSAWRCACASTRTLTNSPGHSVRCRLGKVALTRIVPVVWSIWLSISATVPLIELARWPSRDSATAGTGPRCSAALSRREGLLGQGEDHRDRLDLGDDDDPGRIGRVHVVARIDLADAGAPVDRRADAGVVELRAGVVDGRLVALDLRVSCATSALLRIDGLLAGQVLGREQFIALQVAMRVGERCPILVARGDRRPRARPGRDAGRSARAARPS